MKIQELVKLPKIINTNEKCCSIIKGFRCTNTAKIETVFNGDPNKDIDQVIVKMCNECFKKNDLDTYLELVHGNIDSY